MNKKQQLSLLARDLSKEFPRSPREMIAGYVIAARAVDKCRSVLAECAGEYHSGCPLDAIWLEFIGVSYEDFSAVVATGATDAEIGEWIEKTATPRERIEIIRWNNEMRGKRLSEMPDPIQEYMEDYVQSFIPRNRPVYAFFDIYDLEEQRI